MVVIDSSALIPLARTGQLELVTAMFDSCHVTEEIVDEVVVEGKRGSSAVQTFIKGCEVHGMPDDATQVAELEGITAADASVILIAQSRGDTLLANDKGLIEVARSLDVEIFWVTTLLLKARRDGALDTDEAVELLQDLVEEGMNLHPKVYSKIHSALLDVE